MMFALPIAAALSALLSAAAPLSETTQICTPASPSVDAFLAAWREACSLDARWVAITPNVLATAIDPIHPLFLTWPAPGDFLYDLSETRDTLLGANATDVVMLEGYRCAGLARNGGCLLTNTTGKVAPRAYAVESQSLRPIDLSGSGELIEAVWMSDHWVLMTSSGLCTELPGEKPKLISSLQGCAWYTLAPDELILLKVPKMRHGAPPPQAPIELNVGRFDGRVLSWETFTSWDQQISRVVRLNDGRWLALGERMTLLKSQATPLPFDEDLLAVEQLARVEESPQLTTALECVTCAPLSRLGGLIRLLERSASPERSSLLVAISALQDTIKNLDVVAVEEQKRLKPEEIDHVHASRAELARLLPVLQEASQRKSPGPGELARLLQLGFQLYDGVWITKPRLIEQNGENQTLLAALYWNDREFEGHIGLFQLNSAGKLSLLTDISELDPQYTASALDTLTCARGPGDRLYLLFAGAALVATEGDRVAYIDQSTRMRTMRQLVGVDALDCVYLKSAAAPGVSPCGLWRYRHAAPPAAAEIVQTIGGVLDVARGPSDSVWFIRENNQAGAPDSPDLIANAEPIGIPGNEHARTQLQFAGASPAQARGLYRWDANGGCSRLFSASQMRGTSLAPASGRALLGVTQDFAFCIVGATVYSARDLPTLVTQHFDVLLAAAPLQNLMAHSDNAPAGGYSPPLKGQGPRLTWLRANDILWLAHASTLEAFRAGKPLRIGDRIMLRNKAVSNPLLFGPLNGSGAPAIVLLPQTRGPQLDLTDLMWATQSGDGISLHEFPPVSREDRYDLEKDFTLRAAPVVYPQGGVVLLPNGQGNEVLRVGGPGVYERIADFGTPLDIATDGRMLVARAVSNEQPGTLGWYDPSSFAEMTIGSAEPLSAELIHGGAILCRTPTGIAWLTADSATAKWAVSRRVELADPPISIVGPSGDGLIYVDSSGKLCRWTPAKAAAPPTAPE